MIKLILCIVLIVIILLYHVSVLENVISEQDQPEAHTERVQSEVR